MRLQLAHLIAASLYISNQIVFLISVFVLLCFSIVVELCQEQEILTVP